MDIHGLSLTCVVCIHTQAHSEIEKSLFETLRCFYRLGNKESQLLRVWGRGKSDYTHRTFASWAERLDCDIYLTGSLYNNLHNKSENYHSCNRASRDCQSATADLEIITEHHRFMELVICNPTDSAWQALHTAEVTDPGKMLRKDSGKNSSRNWLSAKSSATKECTHWSGLASAMPRHLRMSLLVQQHVGTTKVACTKAMAAAIRKGSIKTAPTRLCTWWIQHSLPGLRGNQKDFTPSHRCLCWFRAGCSLHGCDTATHGYWVSGFWGC